MKKIFYIWKKYSFILFFIFIPLVAFVDYKFGLIAILCLVAPLIFSFFSGRYYCGNLCPRGSLFDVIGVQLSDHKKTPKLFKLMSFRILVFGVMGYLVTHSIIHYGLSLDTLGYVLCKFILITTLIALTLTTFFNERTWCQICPMGTLAALNLKKIKKRYLSVGESCTDCKVCEPNCPMNVEISKYKGTIISDHDCLVCKKCISNCKSHIIK